MIDNQQRGKTMASVKIFNNLVLDKIAGNKNKDIIRVSEQTAIIRKLLRRAGIDIYRVIGVTPKKTFTSKEIETRGNL